MELKVRVAVVTGGGAVIGRAISLRLAHDGARVAVLDIRPEAAEETLRLAAATAWHSCAT
jgi:NAD(P)-dependent dehydrogenase (short-subunit alcohol dehydrogenase family)